MRAFFAVSLLALSLISTKSFAWGDIGHGSVAEIAERYLSDDAKKLVQSILGPEPMAVAAVWPDQVRSDARFKGFAPYHFVEIPKGVDYSPRELKDGNTIISQVPAHLISANVTRERKMIFLRYLIHVAGDVHQPLHVGNGQDMGANLCNVNWIEPETYGRKKPTARFQNLHTVWDENLIDYMKHEFSRKNVDPKNPQKRWFGYKELADWILAEAKGTDPKVLQAYAADPVLKWYSESRSLHDQVYPEKPFETVPARRKYCKWVNPANRKIEQGAFDAKAIPTLDEAYAKRTAPIIRLQILKGGLRLAKLLNDLAAGNAPQVEKDTELLESILIVNPGVTK